MRYLFSLLAIIYSTFSFAQFDFEGANAAREKFKNSVLIVKLFDENNRISYLEEHGMTQQAEEIRRAVELENTELRKAFDSAYTFTAVYFVHSQDLMKLAQMQWPGLLTDVNGEDICVRPGDFFLADISTTKTAGLYGLNLWEWTGSEWVHPPSPFPYHVSGYKFFRLAKRSYLEMVLKFNDHFVEESSEQD